MHWLLIGYMFLFVDRPFEVWPALGELHVERAYMLVTLAAWAVSPKRLLPDPLHAAWATFAAAVVVCWAASPWADRGQAGVEDWLKVLVFYGLLVTSVTDERGLRRVVVGFVAVMGLYMLHSLREYVGGRHTYRMNVQRLIGVDKSLGDPNSFGASVVYALPFAVALWRAGVGRRLGRLGLAGYVGLSVACILLTGSRSSLLGLAAWAGLLALSGRRRLLKLLGLLAVSPGLFLLLPDDLQARFETIVNPAAGPASAAESGRGRVVGLLTGLDLWADNPLTGVGPGAWRPATGSGIESHNLYGQLLGETGTLGGLAFAAVLFALYRGLRGAARLTRQVGGAGDLVAQVPAAVGTGVLLMLLLGNFGHNLFRFNWLWYSGFLLVARHCLARRLRMSADDAEGEVATEPAELPGGWRWHAGHVPARVGGR